MKNRRLLVILVSNLRYVSRLALDDFSVSHFGGAGASQQELVAFIGLLAGEGSAFFHQTAWRRWSAQR